MFGSKRTLKFTRQRIHYILGKYLAKARLARPDLAFPDKLTPHMLRHSKAVHLLDAGIPLIYIRDILGYSHITTTEIYARVCNETKQKTLEKAYVELTGPVPEWVQNTDLITWLNQLCR
ncbi:MAG: tyrosine-type recombinase/integrase [Lentisphaeria bacterium]